MALAPRAVRPMPPLHPLPYVLLLIALLALPQSLPLLRPAAALPAPLRAAPVSPPALLGQLGRLPLAFEPAAAPAGAEARFQARALGGTLSFDPAGLRLDRSDSAGLRLRFLEPAPAAPEMTDPLPGRVSRFLGSDPALWQRDLPSAAGLLYRGLYPGVDLRYDGAAGRLKGTYLLAPGADPARIRWRYDGAGSVRLDPSGDLQITLAPRQPGEAALTLAERAPVAWQEVGGVRVPVEAAFALASDGGVGFRLGHYDPRLPLTIDPTLEFSSYLGGAGFDSISDIALDAEGNIYAVGTSHANGFPLKNPLQPEFGGGRDAVLLKLSPDGATLLFSTYLGGFGDDEGTSVLVDQRGVALLGNTKSPNFPATRPQQGPAGDWDIFVARLDFSGQALTWSGLLGGSGRDVVRNAVLDSAGRVTLVGTTQSADFAPGAGPVYQATLPNANSAVVAQLSPDGAALTFRSFLAGANGTLGAAIAIAPDGGLVVGGLTFSGFPLKNPLPGMQEYQGGVNDGFVAKLTPGATDLVFSTYLGGNGGEGVNDLVLDSAGTIYVTGMTASDDFPRVNSSAEPAGQDGFVSKLSADGQRLLYSAFQGGNREDELARIRLDPQGNIYLLGNTRSTGMQMVNPLPPLPPENDWPNLLLVKLSNDGQTTHIRTLLGGSGDERGNDREIALAVSSAGRVALGAFTASPDLPLRRPLQAQPAGDYDAMLMVIDTAVEKPPVLPPTCGAGTASLPLFQTFLPKIQTGGPPAALGGRQAAGGLNLAVRHIEVSQAIQCPTNIIPLVAGRPAVARVYVSVQGSAAPVPGVSALLYASRNGVLLPGAPLAPYNPQGLISAPPAPDREQPEHTLNFLLPAAWLAAGPITLWAEVNPQRTLAEQRFDDNRSADYNLTVYTVPDLRVVVIPILYQRNGVGPVQRPTVDQTSNFAMGGLINRYPIANVYHQIHSELLFTGDLGTELGWSQLLSLVTQVRERELTPENAKVFFYGAVRIGHPAPANGIADGGYSAVGQATNRYIAAHELGHNLLGPDHVECDGGGRPPYDPNYPHADGKIGQVGVDVFARQVISTQHHDMMAYCFPYWVSDYNYLRMFQVLRARGPALLVQTAPQDGLLLSGQIGPDGQSGHLSYAVPLSLTAALEQPDAGAYRIELRDRAGALLLRRAFAPTPHSLDEGQAASSSFSVQVPRPADLGRVELWRGERRLDVLTAAPAPHLAAQATPDPLVPGRVQVAWQAASPDGRPVEITLRYSADGGRTWQVLALNLPGSSTVVDIARLPGGPDWLLAVDAAGPTATRTVRLPLSR